MSCNNTNFRRTHRRTLTPVNPAELCQITRFTPNLETNVEQSSCTPLSSTSSLTDIERNVHLPKLQSFTFPTAMPTATTTAKPTPAMTLSSWFFGPVNSAKPAATSFSNQVRRGSCKSMALAGLSVGN